MRTLIAAILLLSPCLAMAQYEPLNNWAKGNVNGLYSSAATEITLQGGHGSRFPDPAASGQFNIVWWNWTDYKDPSDDPNKEIVRVTARSGDVLTITRGQEGSSAANHNTSGKSYRVIQSITSAVMKRITDSLGTHNTRIGNNFALVTATRDTVDSLKARSLIDRSSDNTILWRNGDSVKSVTVTGTGGSFSNGTLNLTGGGGTGDSARAAYLADSLRGKLLRQQDTVGFAAAGNGQGKHITWDQNQLKYVLRTDSVGAGGSGEANTASNLGTGTGVFAQKSVVDLQFKSLKSGTGISISNTATEITITNTGSTSDSSRAAFIADSLRGKLLRQQDTTGFAGAGNGGTKKITWDQTQLKYVLRTDSVGAGGSGEVNTASNLAGAGVGVWKDKSTYDLRFKRLKAGTGTTITDNTDSVTIAWDSTQGYAVTQAELNAKLTNSMATARILGRNTAATGVVEELEASTVKTMLSLNNVTNESKATMFTSPTFTTAVTVPNGSISYAEIQDVSTNNVILGRNTAGAGSMEELSASTAKTILSLNNVTNESKATMFTTPTFTRLMSGDSLYLVNNLKIGATGRDSVVTVTGGLHATGGAKIDGALSAGSYVGLPSNSASAAGTVASGSGQVWQVWKTDGSGNPGWRQDSVGAGGSGEANTASNLAGAGVGLWKDKVTYDLRFKRLKAGTGTTVTDNTDSVTVAWDSTQGYAVTQKELNVTNDTVDAVKGRLRSDATTDQTIPYRDGTSYKSITAGYGTSWTGSTGLLRLDTTQVASSYALSLKAPINSPTFTGTVGGISASMVGLGNVTNESKATMFTSPTFTTAVTVPNGSISYAEIQDVSATARLLGRNSAGAGSMEELDASTAKTMLSLQNVTNESKATMFTSPTFTGTVSGITLNMIGDLTASKSFSMGAYGLTFNMVNPTATGIELNITGAFSGDALHVHQHTGNPGPGTHLIALEAVDADVVPLHVAGVNDTNAVFDGGQVFINNGLTVNGLAMSGTITGLPANSSSAAGTVSSGSGQVWQVWKTDGSGNPAWRPDSSGGGGAGDGQDADSLKGKKINSPPVTDGKVLTYFSPGDTLGWTTPPGAAGGEANTASNLGTNGVGVFKDKSSVDLRFKKLQSSSTFFSVTDKTDSIWMSVDSTRWKTMDTTDYTNLRGNTGVALQVDNDASSRVRFKKISSPYKRTIGAGGYPTGALYRYQVLGMHTNLTVSTMTATSGNFTAYPFKVPHTITIDTLRWEVSTAAGTAGFVFGIYANESDTTLYPTTRLTQSVIYDTASTGVKVKYAGSDITLYAGQIYWLAYSANSATPVVRGIPLADQQNFLGAQATMGTNNMYSCLRVARSYDWTLPSTAPASLLPVANIIMPQILARIK